MKAVYQRRDLSIAVIGGELAPESVDTTTVNPRKRWRSIQERIHRIWQRWMHARKVLPRLPNLEEAAIIFGFFMKRERQDTI